MAAKSPLNTRVGSLQATAAEIFTDLSVLGFNHVCLAMVPAAEVANIDMRYSPQTANPRLSRANRLKAYSLAKVFSLFVKDILSQQPDCSLLFYELVTVQLDEVVATLRPCADDSDSDDDSDSNSDSSANESDSCDNNANSGIPATVSSATTGSKRCSDSDSDSDDDNDEANTVIITDRNNDRRKKLRAARKEEEIEDARLEAEGKWDDGSVIFTRNGKPLPAQN